MEPIENRRELSSPASAWFRQHRARLAGGFPLAVVTVVAGIISYTHICALTLALGGSMMAGHLMPFGVDGQIVMGSVVLLTVTGCQRHWGWLGIVPGLAESLFANYEAGISHGPLAAGWYAVPALAFAVASFLFERWLKAQVTTPAEVAGSGSGETVDAGSGTEDEDPNPCTHLVGSTAEDSAVQAWLHARDCLGEPMSQRALSAAYGLPRSRVAELVGPHLVREDASVA